MDLSNKNILEIYKNYEQSSYILNNFTDQERIGIFAPNQNNPFAFREIDNSFEIQLVDKNNDYKINELGLRGKLNKNSEILAVGCSYTFGVGLPQEGVWTSILSEQINKDILNLGIPGSTIRKICESTIKHVSKHGKPKTIFALFPGFFRGMLIEDTDFYSSSRNIEPKKQHKIEKQISFQSDIYYDRNKRYIYFKNIDQPQFLKSKEQNIRYMENVFSPHQLISDSIDSISVLQDFCYSHGIDFYWSTWHNPTSILMDTLLEIPNFKLKNYVKFANDSFNNYSAIDGKFPNKFCNLSHNSKLANHPSWDCGSDIWLDVNNNVLTNWPSHPGIHFQHHVAELFKDL
jgi:hypothetical protein